MLLTQPAIARDALIDSLQFDPFYVAISKEFNDDAPQRRTALARYFVAPLARAVVAESAWYLSIVGVAPSAQGQGIGARLLEATLAEADAAGVHCYLETFDSRNPRFYRRLGFSAVGTHVEPITRSAYTIMNRPPKALAISPSERSLD